MKSLVQKMTASVIQLTDDFWSLSCGFYIDPTNKKLLHRLQDEQALNINRILFTLWFSFRFRRALAVGEARQLTQESYQLEQWVARIRRLRKTRFYEPSATPHEPESGRC